jgi:SagB-type dehydrogenase family enzyme
MTATTALYRRNALLLLAWDGADLVLEHCDTLRRFRVDGNLLALLSSLSTWTAPEDLTVGERPPTVEQLDRLVELGLLDRSEPARVQGAPEPGDCWSAFDLAVQRRSATGGARQDLAAAGHPPAPPTFSPRPEGPVTSLPEPGSLSMELGEALSRRRSIRSYAERPLTLAELSGLLHHSARVQRTFDDPLLGEMALRPFASAGARGELELYVVANDVAGVAPGAYYYDARSHELVGVRHRDHDQDRLNQDVQAATGDRLDRDPPAVLLVTAVFARVMWKYRDIALALIYKDTGCLLQTLYLAATALDLAPCAVGAGPEAANARWLGLDPMVESQVGCLLLGARQSPPDRSRPGAPTPAQPPSGRS